MRKLSNGRMKGEEAEETFTIFKWISLPFVFQLTASQHQSKYLQKDKYVKFKRKIAQLKRHQAERMVYMNHSNVVVEASSFPNRNDFSFLSLLDSLFVLVHGLRPRIKWFT